MTADEFFKELANGCLPLRDGTRPTFCFSGNHISLMAHGKMAPVHFHGGIGVWEKDKFSRIIESMRKALETSCTPTSKP